MFVITILQLRTLKAQITTSARALVYHELYGSVAKGITHTGFIMLNYCEESSSPVRSRFFIMWPASCNP